MSSGLGCASSARGCGSLRGDSPRNATAGFRLSKAAAGAFPIPDRFFSFGRTRCLVFLFFSFFLPQTAESEAAWPSGGFEGIGKLGKQIHMTNKLKRKRRKKELLEALIKHADKKRKEKEKEKEKKAKAKG